MGIFPLTFGDEDNVDDIQRWLQEYFAGKIQTCFLQITLEGTPFQLKVWHLLKQIPYGKTITYGELARQISPTMSAQAVGQAVGKNPCPVLIPCHRVVGADGSLTGYAYGLELKRRLLSFEKDVLIQSAVDRDTFSSDVARLS